MMTIQTKPNYTRQTKNQSGLLSLGLDHCQCVFICVAVCTYVGSFYINFPIFSHSLFIIKPSWRE